MALGLGCIHSYSATPYLHRPFELFIMDGSKRSTKSNAFFTGFGKNKKIALFDTLVENHSTEGLVAILAHEIGHFKCKHIIKRMISGIIQSAIVFFLIGLFTTEGKVADTLFAAFKVDQVSVYAGLVFFGLLFAPVKKLLSSKCTGNVRTPYLISQETLCR